MLDDRLGARGVAHAPACCAVGFSKPSDEQDILGSTWQAGRAWAGGFAGPMRDIRAGFGVGELVVNLIRDQQDALGPAEVKEVLAFLFGADDSCGVAWGVEEDEFGAVGDEGLDALCGQAQIRVGVAANGAAACERGQGWVDYEIGIGDDDLITGAEHGEEGQEQCA